MTCGECPFYDESVGWCNFTKSEMVYARLPECEARKAYRVLRDEVRRLRRSLWERDYYLKIVKRQRVRIEHMAEKMTDLDLGQQQKS